MHIYNSEYVLAKPHIRRLLMERYFFRLSKDMIDKLDASLYQVVKYKEVEQNGVIVQQFEVEDGEDIYIETFKALARRVARRIALGEALLAVISGLKAANKYDEAKRLYSAKNVDNILDLLNDYIKRTHFKTLDALVSSIVDNANIFEKYIYSLKFLPSSPFMFNAFRAHMDDVTVMSKVYSDNLEFEDVLFLIDAVYKKPDPAYGSCYAMGTIADDTKAIYEMLYKQAEVFRHAGGFGVNFSKLRSKWAFVSTIKGRSSGAISFMKPFNDTTQLIALTSSLKRGANMFILNYDHPEVEDFINAKTDFDKGYENLKYANISVGVNNEFINRVIEGKEYEAVDPHDSSIRFKKDARKIWTNMILNAVLHAEPGIVNFDNINKDYALGEIEPITSTNPCSEYVARDQSVCVLGSVNIYAHIIKLDTGFTVDYNDITYTAKILHRFLTFASFANSYPLPELTYNTRIMRNTGVGYFGLASTLVMLKQRYGSPQAFDTMRRIMKSIVLGVKTSSFDDIAVKYGAYDEFDMLIERYKQVYAETNGDAKFGVIMSGKYVLEHIVPLYSTEELENMRISINEHDIYYAINTWNLDTYVKIGTYDGKKLDLIKKPANLRLLAIAPTGSISYIASVSSGVEPIFYFAYNRRINPNLPSEYTVTVTDLAIEDYLRYHIGKTDAEIRDIVSKLATGEQMKFDDYVVTNAELDLTDRIAMLYVSNSYIDMNTSVTFNIFKSTRINSQLLEKLKLLNDSRIKKTVDVFNDKCQFDLRSYFVELVQTNDKARKAIAHMISNWHFDSKDETYDRILAQLQNNVDAFLDSTDGKAFYSVFETTHKFYLFAQLLGIKGTTVYVEGSRTPILTAVKKDKSKQETQSKESKDKKLELVLNLDEKTQKILPKERPYVMNVLKKKVKFTLHDDVERIMYIELGLDKNDEPFEVFFRPTNSTKEFATLFNVVGRLLSIGIRSNIRLDDLLEQLKKTKNWKNEYDPVTTIMYETVKELIDIAMKKGHKKRESIIQAELTGHWVLTAKGYYIDEHGKKRCPVCKSEINARDGCLDCPQCGWTACS